MFIFYFQLISRLRNQIEQIKNEKSDAERFRDQLEADLVKFWGFWLFLYYVSQSRNMTKQS